MNGRTFNFLTLYISSILESLYFWGPVVEEESIIGSPLKGAIGFYIRVLLPGYFRVLWPFFLTNWVLEHPTFLEPDP